MVSSATFATATFSALVLLAACSGVMSGGTPRAVACPYEPINIDTGRLPQPVNYPTNSALSLRASASAKSPLYGLEEFRDPPLAAEYPMETGRYVRNYHPFDIRYSNPLEKKIAGCGLTLRTYGGELVGPTLRVKPGQTLRFTVENNLGPPVASSASPDDGMRGGEAMYNLDMTNLHTHGLQVDPVGKTVNGKFIASDNVMISYLPGVRQEYEISIPDDHPTGTFWYHAHAHGSTAAQVSSGMAGALIVQDDKSNLDQPDSDRSLLPDSLKVPEKTMVFQSILYDEQGQIANLDISKGEEVKWSDSHRRITINGQLVPKITMRPGEVQRWRLVGATFEQMLRLRLAGHDLHQIALDGHYLPRVDTWNQNQPVDLEAGYRSDILVKANPTPGTYLLISDPDPAGRLASPRARAVDKQEQNVVAAVVVQGPPVQDKALPTTEEMQEIAYGWTNGKEDTPLQDLWAADPINKDPATQHRQEVRFNVATGNDGLVHFAINEKIYPDGGVLGLTLNRIDKWDLITETLGSHIFHIHTNPFQAYRTGPDGQPERVWRDTVIVAQGRPVTMYTQYKRFPGTFVIHCHLLDHEDNGMMRAVEVKEGTP